MNTACTPRYLLPPLLHPSLLHFFRYSLLNPRTVPTRLSGSGLRFVPGSVRSIVTTDGSSSSNGNGSNCGGNSVGGQLWRMSIIKLSFSVDLTSIKNRTQLPRFMRCAQTVINLRDCSLLACHPFALLSFPPPFCCWHSA